jgi:ACS family tartrate transporter-like MFS transporter
MQNLEHRTMIKVWRRIVPLMGLVLFCGYLDRVNLGFAAVTMNQDLGFSNTVFGAGAGFFAIGYALFAIPSALLLNRMGVRRWFSVSMIGWAACSAATAFVTRPEELLAVRLLLGMSEAGFASGVILLFNDWFPNESRGRVLGSFFFINPLCLVIGGPLSSALLSWDGLLGLAGWQWMFIIESLPTLVLALAVFCFLADKPADAHWLSSAEKLWLEQKLASERRSIVGSRSGGSVWQALANKRVWLLAAVYLGIGTSGVGAIIFLPLIIRSIGFSVWNTGFVAALPAAVAAVALPLWGVWTDRSGSPEVVLVVACCAIAGGLLGAAALLPSAWAIVPISVAMTGFFGCLPAFWMLPSSFLSGASAAVGIALINIAGNLGQFSGPYILGWTSDLTRSYGVGLTCLAAIAAAAAAIMAMQATRNRDALNRSVAAFR